jgi:hypothetical protein
MPISISEARLRLLVPATLALMAVAAVVFHGVQNRGGIVGGEIAFSKAAWLALAIWLWIVLPVFIVLDGRLPWLCRAAFAWLLGLMAARAVAEPIMLYAFHNWTPWYGIGHDVLCMAALAACGLHARAAGAWRASPAARAIGVHTIVVALTFVPEVYYAWYMQAHFHTRGGEAIYYVPDDGLHEVALGITAAVDIALGAYLAWFLPTWLHGQAARPGS